MWEFGLRAEVKLAAGWMHFFLAWCPRESLNWTCSIRYRSSESSSHLLLSCVSLSLSRSLFAYSFLSLPPSSYCLHLNLGVTHLVMLLPKSHFLGRNALAEGCCAITCPIIKLSPTISWETPDGRGQSRPDTRRSGVFTGLFRKPPADVFLHKIYWGSFILRLQLLTVITAISFSKDNIKINTSWGQTLQNLRPPDSGAHRRSVWSVVCKMSKIWFH